MCSLIGTSVRRAFRHATTNRHIGTDGDAARPADVLSIAAKSVRQDRASKWRTCTPCVRSGETGQLVGCRRESPASRALPVKLAEQLVKLTGLDSVDPDVLEWAATPPTGGYADGVSSLGDESRRWGLTVQIATRLLCRAMCTMSFI